MAIETFTITLEDAYMLSPRVKHFIFQHHYDTVFDFIPGQFITIHLDHDNKPLRRSYSIANVPTQNNRIEIAAGYIEGGPGTALLYALKPGDTIQVSGPYGRLILKDQVPQRYILVATSTGITPYRAMLDELVCRLQTYPWLTIVILLGVQNREDILYRDTFMTLAKQYPQLSFHPCLSREDPTTLLPFESAGYVQSLFPKLQLNPEGDVVYLCGNPAMIDESFTLLKDQGFPMQHIIREKYISR